MPRTPITAEERTAWPRYGDSVFVDVAPEKWGMVPPTYPDSAREAGVDGTVWVAALVRTDGSVGATLVTKEIPLLNGAATAALMKWRFKPAMAHGKPVATWVTEPVKFALH